MNIRKSFNVLAACLVAVVVTYASPLTTDYTGGPSNFTVNGNNYSFPHNHVASVNYTLGANTWQVWIDPDPATYLRGTGQAGDYFNILTAAYPTTAGWSYQSAARELSENSLIVRWYEAFHGGTSVGANFGIEYAPHEGDPTDVHWLQVVIDNHNLNGPHGTPESVVDEAGAGRLYYDNGGVANNRFLRDRPRRNDDQNAHDWTAYLFLVSGPAIGANNLVPAGLITFYGGVQWGWHNACIGRNGDFCSDGSTQTPEPATFALTGIALLLVARYKFGVKRT